VKRELDLQPMMSIAIGHARTIKENAAMIAIAIV
jgi:hypothetical protein